MAAVENKELLERITELGERSAMGTDIEIAEIQVKGAGNQRLLRVYIDKPGGVTHGDCELISERFGKLLDEEDPIPENSYTLEVSSPGIERRLSKPAILNGSSGRKSAWLSSLPEKAAASWKVAWRNLPTEPWKWKWRPAIWFASRWKRCKRRI